MPEPCDACASGFGAPSLPAAARRCQGTPCAARPAYDDFRGAVISLSCSSTSGTP